MRDIDILQKTMKEMPRVFTSFQFKAKAIDNGYSVDDAIGQRWYPFFRQYADNAVPKGKTWTKREPCEQLNLIPNPEVLTYSEDVRVSHGDGLAKAIEIVKDAGYKVMRRVDDWIEL
tara:strand:+ start:800 stop:1150 length:351 start_codon:yes stop_codon:yes gene_type:complete